MERYTIECANAADRDTLAMILIRNEYTVRHVRRKVGKSNSYTHYIQYWKEEEKREH